MVVFCIFKFNKQKKKNHGFCQFLNNKMKNSINFFYIGTMKIRKINTNQSVARHSKISLLSLCIVHYCI